MAGVVLTAPPKPFECIICQRPEWKDKAGPACASCPSYKGSHYYPLNSGPEVADMIVLGDHPAPPPLLQLVGGRDFTQPRSYHQAFDDSAGKVVKTAVDRVLSRREFQGLQVLYTYGVKCAVDNPNKATINACSTYLKALIAGIAERRRQAGRTGPLVIFACGVKALLALGMHTISEDAALNRVFENVEFAGVKLQVVFTRSLASLGLNDGKFNTLLMDVERAARVAVDRSIRHLERSEVEKDYIYPTSVAEVRDLVDHVIEYSEGDVRPLDWKIAFDTETNTLHPNWDGTKMLTSTFSWSAGKAASVALWHAETPYDPKLAYEHILRLLSSKKPLIWFNGKYDFKVFWKLGWPVGPVGETYWDAYLAEHALEEDKKKFYSLKALTKQMFPQFAGYEDKLHELLEQANARVEFDGAPTIEEALAPAVSDLKLSPALLGALDRLKAAKIIKSHNFQAKTLEKALADEKFEALFEDLRFILGAKKGGEFRKGAAEKAKKVKKETGGFEKIPLAELNFYGAVDADLTRRVALLQVKRMGEEDARLANARESIRQQQKWSKDPRVTAFPVEVLCTTPRPLFNLVRNDYVPRQLELAKIEYNGMSVDLKYLRWGSESLGNTISHTQKQIFDLCGSEFKLGSTQKLAQYLFGVGYKHPDPEAAAKLAAENPEDVFYERGLIRYTPRAYTSKGAIQSTDSVLKSLVSRYHCPLSNLLLSNKKADKGKHTFLDNIEKLTLHFGDLKLHPGFGLTSTSTGRLASSVSVGDARFNAQNIPKGYIGALRDLAGAFVLGPDGKPVFEGVNCKKLFIPDSDFECFGNADAKGAEISVYAAYSHDPALIQALIDGLDAHCFFASEALNPALVGQGLSGEDLRRALEKASIDNQHAWSYSDFLAGKDCNFGKKGKGGDVCVLGEHAYCKRLKALRDNIKRLVFGLLFGAGIRKIAEIAGISLELATTIRDLLFAKFPTIRAFMDRTKWELRTFGIVEGFNGRRRRFLIGRDAPGELRAKAERRAINFKVQGTNSDIVLSVLCKIAPVIENDLRGRLLLTVHDSIGFQVPKKYAGQVREVFTEYGTRWVAKTFPWMPVPYRWDVELGPSYGEVMDAAKYVEGLPPEYLDQLDGYTEEEMLDDLRDPDSFESPDRTTPLKPMKQVRT